MDHLTIDRSKLNDALEAARWEAESVDRLLRTIDVSLTAENRELVEIIRACQGRCIRNLMRLCG